MVGWPRARKVAQSRISARRRSRSVDRAYAASTLFGTVCARAVSWSGSPPGAVHGLRGAGSVRRPPRDRLTLDWQKTVRIAEPNPPALAVVVSSGDRQCSCWCRAVPVWYRGWVMSNDTKTLLVTTVASVVGSAVAVIAIVLTLVGGVRADVRDVRADVRDVRGDVRAVHERLDRFDDRLRAVEVAFGKVEQRLLTIERVILPAPSPAD